MVVVKTSHGTLKCCFLKCKECWVELVFGYNLNCFERLWKPSFVAALEYTTSIEWITWVILLTLVDTKKITFVIMYGYNVTIKFVKKIMLQSTSHWRMFSNILGTLRLVPNFTKFFKILYKWHSQYFPRPSHSFLMTIWGPIVVVNG